MLSKDKRLNLKKDFKWVASGKKIDTKYAKLFLRKGQNINARVGIAISTSLFKKSSQRNKVKRIISAAFEVLYSKLPSTINIVALPKAAAVEVKSGDILLELEERLKDEKIIY